MYICLYVYVFTHDIYTYIGVDIYSCGQLCPNSFTQEPKKREEKKNTYINTCLYVKGFAHDN